MCGEKPVDARNVAVQRGSPPHVRGKVLHEDFEWRDDGITPACAGKRSRSGSAAPRSRDHPRMCGEKQKLSVPKRGKMGSPPHVRGKGKFL